MSLLRAIPSFSLALSPRLTKPARAKRGIAYARVPALHRVRGTVCIVTYAHAQFHSRHLEARSSVNTLILSSSEYFSSNGVCDAVTSNVTFW